MSLPREPAFSLLRDRFVTGWHNILRESYVGESHGYTCDDTAVGTTNGAGPRNVQMFVLAADGTVIHALPGYWNPEDLASELGLALELHAVWLNPNADRAAKDAAFRAQHLDRAANPPAALRARSRWQGFDAKNEQTRLEKGIPRDTFFRDAEGQVLANEKGAPRIKPVDMVVHERMADRPFVPFSEFDIATYFDYGRAYYDNNAKVDGKGEAFMTPKKVARRTQELSRLLDTALRDRQTKRKAG